MKKKILIVFMVIITLMGVLATSPETSARRGPLEIIEMALDPEDYVVGLELGGQHSAAWTYHGEIWIWGYDNTGQLGDGGTSSAQADPVEITSKFTITEGEKIVGVSLGNDHSAAWTSDGDVWMWGYDNSGQLGDGGTNTIQTEPVEITSKFTITEGEKIVGVSLGFAHSAAWTSDGDVWTWGRDNNCQLGDGGTNSDQSEPVEITSKFTITEGEKIVGVSLGSFHSSAWTSDGDVWTWGKDILGQLGDGGTNSDQSEPVEITSKFTITEGEKIVGVSLGSNHSSAWTSDGDVWTWGYDRNGQLGDGGTNTDQDEPFEITANFTVNSGQKIVGVSLGDNHSSAWTSDGDVWTWGKEDYSQLGDGGTNSDQSEPVEITSNFILDSGDKINGLSMGGFHSSAWTSDGDVLTWGRDSNGQLGDGGTNTNQSQPVNISTGGDLEPGPIMFTVSYDSNGGSSVSSEEVDDGELATEPTDPTRTHYTFDGWYTDDGVWSTEWDFDTDTVTEDVTLYAKWLLNEWTLSYDSNGGSAKSPDDYDYGETLIEPADPTRSGYYFDGWFYDDSTFLNEVDWGTDTMPDNDVTVYADWSPKPLYTVSFDENGGTEVDDQSVYDLEYASEPDPYPTRFMYTFDGWYTNEIYTTPWNFATMQITGNTTIYAKWVLQKVVTFDSNGGTAIDTQYIDDGDLATEPDPDPTRLGYDFDAWYEDDITFLDAWNFGSDTVTADITLYAKWTIHVWTVTWDSNDGTPIVPSNVEYNALVTKPTNPTRLGYGFVGWYSDEELTDEWRWNVDRMPDESITLYAKWQQNVDGVIDDFATDAGIGETGKLLMSLGAMVVFSIIFVLVGLPALMTVIIMVIMFTVFLAIGWIPGWIAVIMMVLLFMMMLYSFKSSGGGEG